MSTLNAHANLVVVYGSLLTGLGNHRSMLRADGEFVAECVSVNPIDMYSLGGFPKVRIHNCDQDQQIKGEVYLVREEGVVGPLDHLEGYPTFYNRTKVPVTLNTPADVVDASGFNHVFEAGQVVEAWIYHIEEPGKTPVPNGDWFKYISGQDKPVRVAQSEINKAEAKAEAEARANGAE